MSRHYDASQGENAGFGGRDTYVPIVPPPFTSCTISGIPLNLPDPVSPSVKWE